MQVIDKTKKPQERIVEASNLGPIPYARLVLVPGVNKFVGENGVGKTHLRHGLARALGGTDIAVPLRDGAKKGSLSIDGTPLLALGKVNRTTGEVNITLASTSPLSDLVRPGIKDPAAAERKRIQALLQMIDCKVTAQTIESLVGDDEDAIRVIEDSTGVEPLTRLDIVNVADILRRKMHDAKREWLDAAKVHEGEMTAANPQRPEKYTELTLAAAQEAHDGAVRTHERLSGEASSRAMHEEERKQIRETIGTRPDVQTATELRDRAHEKVLACERTVRELEEQLRAAKGKLEIAEAAEETAQTKLGEVEIGASTYDRRKRILDTEITGATDVDVTKAEQAVTTAKQNLEAARDSDTYRTAIEKRDAAKLKQEEALGLATNFEEIALAVTGQLGDVLTAAGLSNLTVDDGQLTFIHPDGRLEAFSRLSFGQGTRIGAKLLAKHSTDGSVIDLDPDFWFGLSPKNQVEAQEIFVEEGLFVVTEAPANGDLRVEHFGAELTD